MRRAGLAAALGLALASCGGDDTYGTATHTQTVSRPPPACGDDPCPEGGIPIINPDGTYTCEDEQCHRDDECPAGQICDVLTSICVTPPQCRINDDCPDGERCDDGTCVPWTCDEHADCAPHRLCIDDVCVEPDPCDDVSDCPAGWVCFEPLNTEDAYCLPEVPTCDDCPYPLICDTDPPDDPDPDDPDPIEPTIDPSTWPWPLRTAAADQWRIDEPIRFPGGDAGIDMPDAGVPADAGVDAPDASDGGTDGGTPPGQCIGFIEPLPPSEEDDDEEEVAEPDVDVVPLTREELRRKGSLFAIDETWPRPVYRTQVGDEAWTDDTTRLDASVADADADADAPEDAGTDADADDASDADADEPDADDTDAEEPCGLGCEPPDADVDAEIDSPDAEIDADIDAEIDAETDADEPDSCTSNCAPPEDKTVWTGMLKIAALPPATPKTIKNPRLSFASPAALLGDTVTSYMYAAANVKNKKAKLGHAIGHLHVEMVCTDGNGRTASIPLTGSTSPFDTHEKVISFMGLLGGVSTLFLGFDAALDDEDPTNALADIALRRKHRDMMAVMQYPVGDYECRLLKRQYEAYRSKMIAERTKNLPDRDIFYGSQFRPRRLEGAGCTAFGMMFVEMGRFLPRSYMVRNYAHELEIGMSTMAQMDATGDGITAHIKNVLLRRIGAYFVQKVIDYYKLRPTWPYGSNLVVRKNYATAKTWDTRITPPVVPFGDLGVYENMGAWTNNDPDDKIVPLTLFDAEKIYDYIVGVADGTLPAADKDRWIVRQPPNADDRYAVIEWKPTCEERPENPDKRDLTLDR